MNTKVKFLLLLFITFGSISLAFALFISTEYAKGEWAYFNSYPYYEMTARQKITTPVIAEKAPTSPPTQEPLEEIIYIITDIPPETSVALIRRQEIIVSQIIQPETPEKEEKIKLPIKKVTPHSETTPIETHRTREILTPPPKDTWHHAAKLGYDAYKNADYKTAIIHFERALKTSPNKYDIHLQLAYAYKLIGNNSQATKNFRTALDHDGGTKSPFALRREVEQLENRFEVSGYVIYRDEPSDTSQLGADLTQFQTGLELSYQPKGIGFNNGRKLQIYTRILAGMEQDSLVINPDSYQAGLGLRLKPFSDHNLVLSAERLVKVGDFARNDWMIRAGYSLDHGTEYRQDKTKWWSYNLYLDAAMINPTDPDIFLTSQATGGYNMTLTEGLVLQPRLTGLVSWQKDEFRQASLIEAGPGLNLRYYFNDTKYEAYRSYIDLTIEYRIKLSGNSIGSSGPVMSLIVHF